MDRGRRSRGRRPKHAARSQRYGLLLALGVGLLALAAVFTVVAVRTGGFVARPGAATQTPAGSSGGGPALSVTPVSYDLGQISQAKGLVTVEMAVANTGTGDLEIHEMETTCGCTKAALVVAGRAGPWFGMRGHGEWPTGWAARLRPGQPATLRVQYDPDAHGIYRGPIDRTGFIYSNDPAQPRAAVRLTRTQHP